MQEPIIPIQPIQRGFKSQVHILFVKCPLMRVLSGTSLVIHTLVNHADGLHYRTFAIG